jgi:hypothetical protein
VSSVDSGPMILALAGRLRGGRIYGYQRITVYTFAIAFLPSLARLGHGIFKNIGWGPAGSLEGKGRVSEYTVDDTHLYYFLLVWCKIARKTSGGYLPQ